MAVYKNGKKNKNKIKMQQTKKINVTYWDKNGEHER